MKKSIAVETDVKAKGKRKVPSMTEPLGKAIKVMRGYKRMTQEKFVARARNKITQGYISRVEAGLSFPRNEQLRIIVQALGCTHSDLWKLAEHFANVKPPKADREDFIGCLLYTGASSEEIESLNGTLDEDIVADLVVLIDVLKNNNKELSSSDLLRIKRLATRAKSQPPEKIRFFAIQLSKLTVGAFEKIYSLQSNGTSK